MIIYLTERAERLGRKSPSQIYDSYKQIRFKLAC